LIQRSSAVERSAVNRLVVGSNPTAGATFLFFHGKPFSQHRLLIRPGGSLVAYYRLGALFFTPSKGTTP